MMLSSPGWEGAWRLKAPGENVWDARPRKEMRIALGHHMDFLTGYYNKSKECLKVVKILLDPLPQFTF